MVGVLGPPCNINDSWAAFTKIINLIVEKYVPLSKPVPPGTKKHMYPIDLKTREAIKEKKRLSRQICEKNDPELRKEYNKIRNKVKSLTSKARKDYERRLASQAKANQKVIWRYINSKSKTKIGVGDLYSDPNDTNSQLVKTNKGKANILSNFFHSVFTNEPNGDIPNIEGREISNNMSDLSIELNDVRKLLKDLITSKSPGFDGLHPKFFHELAEQLATPLQNIFCQSVEKCTVPNEWKKAKVSAIYKKGNKKIAGNYRPVSLTSIACKLLEQIIRKHIVNHMNSNNLFTPKQFGFISGRSTVLQLLSVLDKWTEALDRGEEIDCIYMDFSKAFDTVPHRRLVQKLGAYGINTSLINWIDDFLSGRTQSVQVVDQMSDWTHVTSGIP